MQQPRLIIIAGCNGSGKSTYSQALVGESLIPFDYDFRFIENYNKLRDSELREQIAKNQTTEELENLIERSFEERKSVCFETNLDNFPHNWIEKARELDFLIEIYFFCLNDISKAKERVLIRTKNDGHYVADHVVKYKWKEGYKNINKYYSLADEIVFIDNSDDDGTPVFLFGLYKIEVNTFEICIYDNIPEYTQRRLPKIFELLEDEE